LQLSARHGEALRHGEAYCAPFSSRKTRVADAPHHGDRCPFHRERGKGMATKSKRPTAVAGRRTGRIGRPPGARTKDLPRPVDGPYLTIAEFCALFGVSRATFHRTHAAGLRILKFGQRTLIPRADVERYAESLTREPTEPGEARANP
jgi:excisionase family DNA binding protein